MTQDDKLKEVLAAFMDEARDMVAQMEELLLSAEHGGCEGENLNVLFRCAHTIKGAAGLFGLDEIVRFTHVVETVLSRLRNGSIQFSADLVGVLLHCKDHMSDLISAIAEGSSPDTGRSDELIDQLGAWTGEGKAADAHSKRTHQVAPLEPNVTASGGGALGGQYWHLSLRFDSSVLAEGLDPLSFIKYLSTLGKIVHVETVFDALPEFDAADPELCYLGFEVALDSDASKAEIEAVFAFVAESARIIIVPPNKKIEEYQSLIAASPEDGKRLGEMLVSCGTLTPKELDQATDVQSKQRPPSLLGQILVEQQAVEPVVVEAALERQRRGSDKRVTEVKNVKVPAARLDALIDRVGELVIAGAGTHAQARKTGQTEIQESASFLLALVEDIRDMVLNLRMVAIGEIFSRFPRVVRDVSMELGKDINLQINGAESELDKSMIEKISDPLMHLVRNAMDHGIESTAQRVAVGKSATGTVQLNAYHESGLIIIEVKDDGGGLDPAKILRKAVEKGLVSAEANLSEQEIFRLILEPGFSTAEKVSNLSGRGVGMDVVRSNVEALRGTLDIQSVLGESTTMRLCLPLTLAIIDGFHVGVGDAQFIVPLDMVVECIELPAGVENVDYIELRDEALPFVRMRNLFGASGEMHARPRVVVVHFAGKRVGLVVDRIYGKCQTVIKPLGPLFEHVPCVSGSTILGDGEVALIIDVARLISGVVVREAQKTRAGGRAQKSTHNLALST